MPRIFIIDDHELLRDMLRAGLEADGHEVIGEAAGPTAAVAEAMRLQPDLVLLDLHLGERSGHEVLAEFQRRRFEAPVIVVSMSEQPRDIAEALRLGAAGYVRKGSSRSELRRAIDVVLAGGRHLGEHEAALAAAAPAQADRGPDVLSPRERQIAVMVARGGSSSEIGTQMHLSPKTVDTYRSRLMAKLGLSDVPALVRWAVREGLVGLDER
ncbi:MAG: response regulator transcription factor, partial [Piscinibacter sp.]|nr:response regulator transcription factor [Piscinibacter sp.]